MTWCISLCGSVNTFFWALKLEGKVYHRAMSALPMQAGVGVRSTHSLITVCAERQTCFTRVESGEVVVKLRGTEIVRVSAAGDVTLDAGGKRTVSTGLPPSLPWRSSHMRSVSEHSLVVLTPQIILEAAQQQTVVMWD